MAVQTRRYRFPGVTTAKLQEFVAASAALSAEYVGVVEAQVNDALAGAVATLDEYMASLGYVLDATAPTIPLTTVAAVSTWGNNAIASGADTRFLDPGYNQNLAHTIDDTSWPCPKAGTLKNFIVRHNIAIGNGQPVVYDVMKNGVATGITVSVITGVATQSSDLVNTASVAVGDLISIRATKAASIGSGTLDIVATLEIQ